MNPDLFWCAAPVATGLFVCEVGLNSFNCLKFVEFPCMCGEIRCKMCCTPSLHIEKTDKRIFLNGGINGDTHQILCTFLINRVDSITSIPQNR